METCQTNAPYPGRPLNYQGSQVVETQNVAAFVGQLVSYAESILKTAYQCNFILGDTPNVDANKSPVAPGINGTLRELQTYLNRIEEAVQKTARTLGA